MSGTNYTPSLRLAQPVPGNPAVRNVWGTILNTDMDLTEAAITGSASVPLVGATATLTAVNGAADQSRPAVITFTGSPGVTCTVTVPAVPKIGWYINSCADLSNVILTTGGGTTVTLLANGTYYLVRCDGTNMTLAQVYSSSNLLVPWTPVLTFGGASVGMSYTSQVGLYVRTGLVVHYTCVLILATKGSSTGNAVITGLPFLPSGLGNYGTTISYFSAFNGLTEAPEVTVKTNPTPGRIDLFYGTGQAHGTPLTDTAFSDVSNLYFNGFYLLQ